MEKYTGTIKFYNQKKRYGFIKYLYDDEEMDGKVETVYRNTRHLAKKMVDAFVEKIEIFSAGRMTVHLVFDGMLQELEAYTKESKSVKHTGNSIGFTLFG